MAGTGYKAKGTDVSFDHFISTGESNIEIETVKIISDDGCDDRQS